MLALMIPGYISSTWDVNLISSADLVLKWISPKGDLWVQSPMIIVGQSPNIRSIAENRRRSTEAYRRVMSTWPSMMVGTAEGDLPKLFSPALLA